MDRRRYLIGCAGVAAGLAGCENLPTESSDTPGADDGDEDEGGSDEDTSPVTVVEQFYENLDSGNIAEANSLIHADSPEQEIPEEEGSTYRDDYDITVNGTELLEEDGDRAVVRVELTIASRETGEEQTSEQFIVLRGTDDGWKFYESRDTRPEETPTEDTPDGDPQVTNRVNVVSTVGDRISDGEVNRVRLMVAKAPGAGDIDLSDAVVQWVDDSGVYDLTYDGSGATFDVTAVKDDDGSLSGPDPVLNDAADRAQLVFDLPAFRDGGLAEGTSATVEIVTQSGGSTSLILNVPQTLSGQEAVVL